MRHLTRAIAAAAIGVIVPAMATASVHGWVWDGDPGEFYSDAGGAVNWAESTYDDVSQVLTWRSNFGAVPGAPGVMTDGFTLALNSGFLATGNPGEMAHLYFDAAGPDVRMNVFTYNGNDNVTSHEDGSAKTGNQEPDRIASSLLDSSWVLNTEHTMESDGTVTMGFTIDATAINAHIPVYPGDGPYTGISFGEAIGIWFHPLAGSTTVYENGWLTDDTMFAYQGYFDVIDKASEPVPEGPTVALVAMGLLAGWASRRRRR